MLTFRSAACTLSLLIASALQLLPARANAAQDAPKVDSHSYVVLVGIGDYPDQAIKPRPRAEADAKALYDLFINKDYLGVAPDHIRLLLHTTDAQRHSLPATRANVLDALHWIVANAARDDLVIFAFIGQGAAIGTAAGEVYYLTQDTTLKGPLRNALLAADLAAELDKLKSRRFCALIDVSFKAPSGDGSLSDQVTGSFHYIEFRGTEKQGQQPPGRVLLLATDGTTQALDLPRHGLFTQLLIDGLKGAADEEGYEPDGVVTANELINYLEKRGRQLALAYGKTPAEQQQTIRYSRGPESNFVITRNPTAMRKIRERLSQLSEVAKNKGISEELVREGEVLLSRMPKLEAQRELRKEYQRLASGTLGAEQFRKSRDRIIESTRLRGSDARVFADKIMAAVKLVGRSYVKELKQAQLLDSAVRGLYETAEEKIPAAIADRLRQAESLNETDLTALVTDARDRLGKREDLSNHKDVEGTLKRMLGRLDRLSTYIEPVAYESFQRTSYNRQYTGIGVQVRKDAATDYLRVVTPLRGSPCYKAGIHTGDLITTITRETDGDGKPLSRPEAVSTKGLSVDDAVKKLLGKAKTRVKLTIEREGFTSPLEFEIARDAVESETVIGIRRKPDDSWDYMLDPVQKFGYVRITLYSRSSARDLDRVLKDLTNAGLRGLVLDLRSNSGGYLDVSIAVADLLIDDGLIVTVRGRAGERPYNGQHAGSYLNFPIVCLINDGSASGTEIIAACLQDHQRALVMGERSAGAASVQNIEAFDGGQIKLTTNLFWRPNGKNLDKSATSGKEDDEWGVVPDKLVQLSAKEKGELSDHMNQMLIIPRRDQAAKKSATSFRDRQLETALDYLRGKIRTPARTR
jgi:C-terminal peptidase prc